MTDEEIIELYNNNWEEISYHKYLSEEFIEKYAAKVNWKSISAYQKLSEEFVKKYSDKIFWNYISVWQKLSEEFIEEFADKVDWVKISSFQKLSEEFIEKYSDKVDWKNISYYQNLSEEFIEKFANKINWAFIFYNKNLSKKLMDKINNKKIMKNKYKIGTPLLRNGNCDIYVLTKHIEDPILGMIAELQNVSKGTIRIQEKNIKDEFSEYPVSPIRNVKNLEEFAQVGVTFKLDDEFLIGYKSTTCFATIVGYKAIKDGAHYRHDIVFKTNKTFPTLPEGVSRIDKDEIIFGEGFEDQNDALYYSMDVETLEGYTKTLKSHDVIFDNVKSRSGTYYVYIKDKIFNIKDVLQKNKDFDWISLFREGWLTPIKKNLIFDIINCNLSEKENDDSLGNFISSIILYLSETNEDLYFLGELSYLGYLNKISQKGKTALENYLYGKIIYNQSGDKFVPNKHFRTFAFDLTSPLNFDYLKNDINHLYEVAHYLNIIFLEGNADCERLLKNVDFLKNAYIIYEALSYDKKYNLHDFGQNVVRRLNESIGRDAFYDFNEYVYNAFAENNIQALIRNQESKYFKKELPMKEAECELNKSELKSLKPLSAYDIAKIKDLINNIVTDYDKSYHKDIEEVKDMIKKQDAKHEFETFQELLQSESYHNLTIKLKLQDAVSLDKEIACLQSNLHEGSSLYKKELSKLIKRLFESSNPLERPNWQNNLQGKYEAEIGHYVYMPLTYVNPKFCDIVFDDKDYIKSEEVKYSTFEPLKIIAINEAENNYILRYEMGKTKNFLENKKYYNLEQIKSTFPNIEINDHHSSDLYIIASGDIINSLGIPGASLLDINIMDDFDKLKCQPFNLFKQKKSFINKETVAKLEDGIFAMIKCDAKDAIYNVAAKQAVVLAKSSILAFIRSQSSHKFSAYETLLETQVGDIFAYELLGYTLTYAPKIKDNEIAQNLAKELRIAGMAATGNMFAEALMKGVLPAINDIVSGLPAVNNEALKEEDILEEVILDGAGKSNYL